LTVYEYDPNGDGAADYSAFTEEVIERLNLEQSTREKLHVVKKKKAV
jgi:hypothetical protein